LKPTPEQRFFANLLFVDKWFDDGTLRTRCMEWTASRHPDGYGQFWDGTRLMSSHRWIWQRWVGPIPEGMQVDHRCENTACQNVRHMKVTTPWENNRRGNSAAALAARKTHCVHGHEFTPENTRIRSGQRRCLMCDRRHKQESKARRKKSPPGPHNVDQ
jgi:hypothetical protein